MEASSDGFMIAEEDLKLRGPGDLFGTRQHGLPALEMADLVRHGEILKHARGRSRSAAGGRSRTSLRPEHNDPEEPDPAYVRRRVHAWIFKVSAGARDRRCYESDRRKIQRQKTGNPPAGHDIRPTTDKTKEALFSIPDFDCLEDARVLDLFAGTGALGIEALSRGASECVFA